jgi:hypothetical protein
MFDCNIHVLADYRQNYLLKLAMIFFEDLRLYLAGMNARNLLVGKRLLVRKADNPTAIYVSRLSRK